MSILQSFRDTYGLTVNDTANLLQCPRAQISMTELGKRSLPDMSKKILNHLEKAIEQFVPKSGITTSKPASVTVFINKKIKKHNAALEQLTLEKEAIEQKIAAALHLQNLLAALKNYPLPPEADEAILQIQILERKLPEKLKKLYLELATILVKVGGVQGQLSAALNQL